MSISIPIVIHNRKEHTKRQLQLEVLESETVKSVEDKLSVMTGIARDQLNILMCGHVLEESTSIKELLLGPTTSLVALVVEHGSLRQPSTSLSSPTDDSGEHSLSSSTPQIGSFYVWCKGCDDISRGKLRVYCSGCSSSAVVVRSEPQGWLDVLRSRRIEIDCEDCRDEKVYAVFKFKCIICSELCAPLSHIRGNWEQSSCCVCAEDSDLYLFDLGCRHSICRDCFQQYVTTSLAEARFEFKPPYGYTVTCPYTGCDVCVKDVHHFYVLGTEQYRRYQKMATEKLIALDDQGVFCPYPDCSSSFFWETEDDDGMTSCPDCFRLFCRHCKSRECTCHVEDASALTIQATTKKCPRCAVSTERNGGCAHMKCASCGLHWCFLCVKPWAEDCQWDHWFD